MKSLSSLSTEHIRQVLKINKSHLLYPTSPKLGRIDFDL